MNRLKSVCVNFLLRPAGSLGMAFSFLMMTSIGFYVGGLYEESNFFKFGPPVNFMGKEIKDDATYYTLVFVFFLHQVVNNFVNQIAYPWIINCVQDTKAKNTHYNKPMSLILVNIFDIYSQFDMVLILAGMISQISFVITIVSANLLTSTIINYAYIYHKSQLFSSEKLGDMSLVDDDLNIYHYDRQENV